LSDGLGNTVIFRNTIIIMTSNLGARHLQSALEWVFQAARMKPARSLWKKW